MLGAASVSVGCCYSAKVSVAVRVVLGAALISVGVAAIVPRSLWLSRWVFTRHTAVGVRLASGLDCHWCCDTLRTTVIDVDDHFEGRQ